MNLSMFFLRRQPKAVRYFAATSHENAAEKAKRDETTAALRRVVKREQELRRAVANAIGQGRGE
jgi:hypothetical protein